MKAPAVSKPQLRPSFSWSRNHVILEISFQLRPRINLNTSLKKKNGHLEWPYLPEEMGDVSHLHEASNIKCYVIAESSWKDKKAILIEIVPRSIDPFLSNGFPVQINSSARQSSGIYRDKSYF